MEAGLRGRIAASGAVTAGLYVVGYTAINRVNEGRPAHVLFLPGEKLIPLVPAFAPIYLAGFLLPLLVIWATPSWRHFRRTLLSFGIVVAVAFAAFLAFPVALERPAASPAAERLLRLAYWDRPSNDFPSLHVAVNWLVYFSCRGRVRHRALLLGAVLAVSVSTVFVKQHYFVDIPAGFFLSAFSWRAAGRLLGNGSGCESAPA